MLVGQFYEEGKILQQGHHQGVQKEENNKSREGIETTTDEEEVKYAYLSVERSILSTTGHLKEEELKI